LNKLLLVDDDAMIRRIAAISLGRVGNWDVSTAESGVRALELLETYRPDVIMLDVMMPELDGPGTFQAIRAMGEFAKTPIIFMTAKVQTHEVQNYYRLGISGVIIKPFDPLTISAEVESIYNRSIRASCVA